MEGVINCVVEVLVNIFDMYIIYRYMTIFFEDKFANRKLAIVMYGVRFSLLFLLGLIELPALVGFIMYIAFIFAITLCYSASILKKCIVTIMIFMFAFIGETVIAVFVGLSGFDILGQNRQMDSFCKVIMELVFWMITLIVQKFQNVKGNTSVSKAFLIAIIVIPVSSVYLEYMIFQQKNVDGNMASFSLLCVLSTNFILIYLYDSLAKLFRERTKTAIIEREKEYYHEQAEVLKRQQEESKQFRHDFKNRMVVIEGMINDHQYDRVLEYTRQIAKKMTQTNVYSSSGNLAIDSVINYKLSRAIEQGINVSADVVLPECVFMDEDDIVVILGNLLDNAIEASQILDDNMYISIDVKYDIGTLFIHVENRYDSIINRDGQRFFTRKKDADLHGIGLQSVKTIIEKYNGEMEIEHDNGIFIVDILLYL